jgi:hypothetical protein
MKNYAYVKHVPILDVNPPRGDINPLSHGLRGIRRITS